MGQSLFRWSRSPQQRHARERLRLGAVLFPSLDSVLLVGASFALALRAAARVRHMASTCPTFPQTSHVCLIIGHSTFRCPLSPQQWHFLGRTPLALASIDTGMFSAGNFTSWLSLFLRARRLLRFDFLSPVPGWSATGIALASLALALARAVRHVASV